MGRGGEEGGRILLALYILHDYLHMYVVLERTCLVYEDTSLVGREINMSG